MFCATFLLKTFSEKNFNKKIPSCYMATFCKNFHIYAEISYKSIKVALLKWWTRWCFTFLLHFNAYLNLRDKKYHECDSHDADVQCIRQFFL